MTHLQQFPERFEEPDYSVPRFEDEHPEAAEVIVRIGRWPESRKLLHWVISVDGHMRTTDSRFIPPSHRATLPGRNEKCGCGSGRKFKQCCLSALQPINS